MVRHGANQLVYRVEELKDFSKKLMEQSFDCSIN